MKVPKGLGQAIEKVHFSMSALQSYELFSVYHTYFPLVISINYQKNEKLFAFISYGHFRKDSAGKINGAQITKQVVLVSTSSLSSLDQWDSV